MKPLNEYIRKFDEDTDIEELEKFDYVVYTRPDGITYYGVKKDAPEEAHFLASGASQGDPESIKIIDGVVEIASGDDDISEDLLDWSGLNAIWEKYRLNDYELFMDLAAQSDHIDIAHESWGGDAPGISGVWMTASTKDEESLKKDMRDLVAKLIGENRRDIRKKLKNHE